MLRLIVLFTLLLITWVTFSGFTDIFFISCGIISCSIAVYFSQKMKVIDEGKTISFRPTSPLYILWLCKEIVISSMSVAAIVWKEKLNISPVLSWTKTGLKSDVSKTIYANSITLTPGTVCIEVDGDMVQVQSLTKEGMSEIKQGTMCKKIQTMVGK